MAFSATGNLQAIVVISSYLKLSRVMLIVGRTFRTKVLGCKM